MLEYPMLKCESRGLWHSGGKQAVQYLVLSTQDKEFSPYLGQLARLAFLSSAIHQTVFTIFSSLPFAVGQVGSKTACSVDFWPFHILLHRI